MGLTTGRTFSGLAFRPSPVLESERFYAGGVYLPEVASEADTGEPALLGVALDEPDAYAEDLRGLLGVDHGGWGWLFHADNVR